MSYANGAAATTPAATRVAQAIVAAVAESNDVVRRWVKAVHAEHVRRATYRQLSALDDHTLRDIGLARASIRSAVERLELE